MTTERSKKSSALRFLEARAGGPLTLGRLLESIRLGEAQSQAAFARALGISRSHLCDIEHGRKTVSLARAAHFAEVLGYPSDQFVRLTLQAMVEEAGLPLKVKVHAA
jgi:transcriptional regulator with XRE-family HTH domain